MTNAKKATKPATEQTTKDLWVKAQAELAAAQKAYKDAAAAAEAAAVASEAKPEDLQLAAAAEAAAEAAANAADDLGLAEYKESEADFQNTIHQIREGKIVFNASKLSQLMRAEGKSQKVFLAVVRFMSEKANSTFQTLCAQAGIDHDDPLFLTPANVATRLQNAPAKMSGKLDSPELLEAAYGKSKLTAHRTAAMMAGRISEKVAAKHTADNVTDDNVTDDVSYLSEADSLDI